MKKVNRIRGHECRALTNRGEEFIFDDEQDLIEHYKYSDFEGLSIKSFYYWNSEEIKWEPIKFVKRPSGQSATIVFVDAYDREDNLIASGSYDITEEGDVN